MISKGKFIEKVKAEVFPKLVKSERERKRALYLGVLCHLLALIITCLSLYSENKQAIPLMSFTIFLVLSGFTFWASFVKTGSISGAFLRKRKRLFFPVWELFENLNHEKGGNEKLLEYCCLLPKFDYVTYDDCFSGTFDGVKFSVAEFTFVFHGAYRTNIMPFWKLYIDIPLNMPISGYTLLFNQKTPKKFPILKKIKLEDVTFNREYQVYSNDQIEARALLTPAFIERLDELKKAFRKERIDISFFGNHAVFIIPKAKDLFEPRSVFHSVTDIKIYERFYDEIKAINDMIKILNITDKRQPNELTDKIIFNKRLYSQISAKKYRRTDRLMFFILLPLFLLLLSEMLFFLFIIFYLAFH